ncbi:MAG: carboxypeptidase regulatory-like domain-containing protein, partial [Terriglobia bacterium]
MKRSVVALVVVLAVSAGALVAQVELAGRIEGVVMDESKAVIPGASVTATHVATNTVYRATTTAVGRFTIPSVRRGLYTVVVEAPGFRRQVVTDVLVEVGGTADLNITMEVGAVEEEVTVTAETTQEVVNTVDAELGAMVNTRRVLELPLDGRNATHLVRMQPGVYYELDPVGRGNKFFVHGQRHRSVNITLDGVDTQDNLNRASSIMFDQPLIHLAAENVQEFRVVTGNSSAEFTRGGAQITAVTRSGSNEWHGSVFWFHRNDVFRANDFFANKAGNPVPKLLRHQFGGRIGGPIVRDKTFFFFGYEQMRVTQGIPVIRTVFTAEARQGIFRYLDNLRTTPLNVANNPGLIRTINLLDCTGAVAAALTAAGRTPRDCVDGRFTLASPQVVGSAVTLDPFISGTVLAAIPLPNSFDVGDGLNTGGFRFNSGTRTRQHLPAFRLDHRFSDKHTFYATFNYTDREILGDFINNRETIYPALPPLGFRITHARMFTAGLSSSFSPTFINEFRAGVLSGENAFIRNQPFNTPDFTLAFNDFRNPYSPGGGDSVRDNETWSVRDSFTWVRGKHQIKVGGEFRHRWLHNYSFFETQPFGEIHFDDNDNDPGFSERDLRALSTGGTVSDIESVDMEAARDILNDILGAVGEVEARFNVTSLTSGFVLGAPERRLYQVREFDAFFNDTWRISPNLTLNLGVRWELATVPFETQRLLLLPEGGVDAVFGVSGPDGWFNPGVFAGQPCRATFPFALDSLALARTSANAINMITSCATRFIPGGSNNALRLWDTDYDNFGPVIGLAWDPLGDGKMAVRAGYRLSYMQDHFAIIHSNVDDNEGLRVDQDCVLPDFQCSNTPPAPFLLRDIVDASGATIGGTPVAPIPPFQIPAVRSILDSTFQDFRTYVTNLDTPYYQEWNLSISREFFRNTAVEIRYVGNRGVKLRRVQ